MRTLTIHKERLPERCEICHQADMFEPLSEKCGRCSIAVTPAMLDAASHESAVLAKQRLPIFYHIDQVVRERMGYIAGFALVGFVWGMFAVYDDLPWLALVTILTPIVYIALVSCEVIRRYQAQSRP